MRIFLTLFKSRFSEYYQHSKSVFWNSIVFQLPSS
uniref:Uncharacterized protein n=1 Tax=Anguilla anguilla TaxID=7936 RepID=A0A0E9TXD6_ANGAN